MMKAAGKEKTGPKFAALRAVHSSDERSEWTWLLGEAPETSARRRRAGVFRTDRRLSRLWDKQELQWKNEATRWAVGKLSATQKEFKPSDAILVAWAAQGRELAQAGRFAELEGWEEGAVSMVGHESRWGLLLEVMEGVERWMDSQSGGMSDAAAWAFASWMIAREDRKPALHALAAQGDAWKWADLATRASILAQRQAGIPEVAELRRLQEAEMAQKGQVHEAALRASMAFPEAADSHVVKPEEKTGDSTADADATEGGAAEAAVMDASIVDESIVDASNLSGATLAATLAPKNSMSSSTSSSVTPATVNAPRGVPVEFSEQPAAAEPSGVSGVISPWDAEAVCGWLLAAEENRKRQNLAEISPKGPLSFAAARERDLLDSDTEWARAIGRWANEPSPALILAAIAKKAAKEAQRRAWAGGPLGLENWRAWAQKNNWPLPLGWAEGNSQKHHPWIGDAKSKRRIALNVSQAIMQETGAMGAAPPKAWPQLWAQAFRIFEERALNKNSRQRLGRQLLGMQWKGGTRGEASRGAVHNWIAHCGAEAGWRDWAKALFAVSALAMRDHEPFSIDSKRWYYGFLMLWRKTQDRWGLTSPLWAKILEFPVAPQIQCMPGAWGGEHEWVLRALNDRFSLADCAVGAGDELFVDWAEGQTGVLIRKNAEIRFAEALREAQPLAVNQTGKQKAEWHAMSNWAHLRESAWVAQELQEEMRRASAFQALTPSLSASVPDAIAPSGEAAGKNETAGATQNENPEQETQMEAEATAGAGENARSSSRGSSGAVSGRLRRPDRL